MYRFTNPLIVLIIMAALSVTGCQNNPVSPDTHLPNQEPGSHTGINSHQYLGFHLLSIDTTNQEIEVLSVRSAGWHLNVVGILNQTMGVSAVGVPSESNPAYGLFVFDITLTHPFDTQQKFAGFDVKGILITPGSLEVSPLIFADVDETRLRNADGYTQWWNPTEFTDSSMFGYIQGNLANAPGSALTATINPYKYFADRLDFNDSMGPVINEPMDADMGRGVFTAGSSNTRRYTIQFPMDPDPQVVFGYAVDAAWFPPDPNPPVDIPDDFPINANQQEPYNVLLFEFVNSLYFDEETGTGGGVLRVGIYVSDWQGQDSGDIQSEIADVVVNSPTLMAYGVSSAFVSQAPTYALYSVDLTGLAVPTEAGEALLICRVTSSDGSTYQQTSAPAPNYPISNFQVLTLKIPEVDCLTDHNNDWSQADLLEFGFGVGSQVCDPDDPDDYYYFNFDPGTRPSGTIRLFCDVEPMTFGLYDEYHNLISECSVCFGSAYFVLDDYLLLPTNNYVKIHTSATDQVAPYYLELDADVMNVTPDVPPTEVTPPGLFCKPERVWNAHSYWILTGSYGYWVYKKDLAGNFEFIFYEQRHIGNDACYVNPRFFFIDSDGPFSSTVSYISFSDPENPIVYEDVINIPGFLDGICATSTHLFVGTPNLVATDVYIYSISDPVNPVEVATLGYIGAPSILDVMNPGSMNKKLIVGTDNEILAFDIDDLENITPDGEYTIAPGILTDIYTDLYRLYYTHFNTATLQGKLHVLEHNTVVPNDFAEVGWKLTAGDASSVFKWTPNAFIADGNPGLTICNVDDPTNILIESTTPMISNCINLAVYGDTVCAIPEHAGMQAFDVSNESNPTLLATLPVVNAPVAAEIEGDYLFAAERAGYHWTVKSVDISDPPNSHLVDTYILGDMPSVLSVDGDVLAVCTSYQCYLLNVTNPESMVLHDSISLSFIPTAVSVYNDVLYITVSSLQLLIYNISNPSSPVLVNSPSVPVLINSISIENGYMYLSSPNGIDIWSLADPLSPAPVTSYSTIAEVEECVALGNYLYLVTPTTVEIVDISNPASPGYLGDVVIDPLLELTDITVDGQFAYVQGGSSGVYACSLWPADNPTSLGELYDQYFIALFGFPTDLIVNDGFLYGATRHTGIRIHDLY